MSSSMPLLDSDDTLAFGEDDLDTKRNRNSFTHPYVTFFHLAFRGASVVAYISWGLFSDSFIAGFVVVTLLLSVDFWTVKNITGRLMVGLRWWNYVDDDGKSHWVFESRKDSLQNRINEREARIFWTALMLTTFIWSIFFITALFGFKLKWLLLVIIALLLNGSNLYGYIKCKVGGSENLSTVTSNFIKKQVLQNAVTMVTRQSSNSSNQSTNVV